LRHSEPPPECIRESLKYDAETGLFTWVLPRKCVRVGALAGDVNNRGYARLTFNRRCYQSHRLAWFYVHNRWPKMIDHIDGNKLNNRIENLREVTSSQNRQNLRTANRDSKTGFLGVTKLPNGRFMAQIGFSGKTKYIGMFGTPESAHEAYLSFKRLLHPAGTI